MTASAASVQTSSGELDYRPSYGAAAIAGAVVFLLYIVTLSPSTAMWDTSEYIASAYIMGLPHPPGNPFFVILGRFFSILPIAPNVAERVNILAALCSAVSAGMWFLIAERVLVGWVPKRWQRIAGGALATLIGATAFTVWAQSVVNEKVYTESLVGMAITAWLAVRWCDAPDGPKADRLLVLIAYISGIGYANHMAGFLALPAVFVSVLIRRPQTFLRWKLVLAVIGALILGLTPFLTQPIRSAHFPRINEGETTACATQIGVSCTFSDTTYQRFMYNFNRTQYGKPAVTDRQVPFTAQVGMWWLYFKWQWLRDANGTHAAAQLFLAWVFLILGLIGGYVHWKYDRRSFWFFGPLIFTVTLLLIYYMNFKYGYSQAPELGDAVPREVRDRDYFYIWSYSAWGVWAALGLFWVWERVAQMIGAQEERVGRETVVTPRQSSWIAASPLLVVAFVPLFANWGWASRHGQTDTRDFAHDLLESVEPYGVLITVGDNDTFPLWYAQEVEHIRPDVTVLCTSLLNTDWYTRQLIRQDVRPYDLANGPSVYAGKSWPHPAKIPLDLSFAQSDAVPPVVEMGAPQELQTKSGITFSVQPRDLGGGYHGLERADLFVLYIIRDAFPSTPVYFSVTDGNYPDEMGFGDQLVTTGLARKLVPATPTAGNGVIQLPSAGWFDVNTTFALWTKTFWAPTSLAKRNGWVDKPSAGIPYSYVRTGLTLATGLQQLGRTADAQKVMQQTEALAKGTQLLDLLAAAGAQQ